MDRVPGRKTAVCWGAALYMAVVATVAASADAPPKAPVRPVTDSYFGTNVVDNYRWLEDQKSAETKAWMKGQADYTRGTLDSMPGRAAFSARMQTFLDAEPFTLTDVTLAGDRIFYRKRLRGASQETLVVRAAAGGAERELLDMNKLSKPGRHAVLTGYKPSPDGRLVAAMISEGGEEISNGRFIDTDTGKELPDRIDHVFDSVGFATDGKTFYYMAIERLAPGASPLEKFRRTRSMAHTLGTDGTKDPIVLVQGTTPEVRIADYNSPVVWPLRHAPYAIGLVVPGTDSNIYVYLAPTSALTTHRGWKPVFTLADKVTDVYVRDQSIYAVTFAGAPNGKLIRLDAANPDVARAEVVVPPSDTVLTSGINLGTEVLHPGSDALYLRVVRDGHGAALRVPYGPHPAVETLPLPAGMQVDYASSDEDLPGVMLRLNSWTDPGDFYRYDPSKGQAVATGLIQKNDTDLTDRVAEEVMVKAKDGTAVPLSIVYRKGLVRDGKAPTMMIGYGAYGDAWTPAYSRGWNAWLARGGIIAVAHVRGGGEFGERWHLAGQKLTKHNTWEDFIACGHYLIDHQYTSTPKLGIWSQSAGGILIGRTITTEPGLVAAAIDGVPLSDTLRFEAGANGPANIPEFGSVKTREGFEGLHAMGAYYHLSPGQTYPYVLVTAGMNDPRVDPWQGAKMAAGLQAVGSANPVMLRVNFDAGHFADTVAQANSDWTDNFTFLLWAFGEPDFQPKPMTTPQATARAANPM